jgi:hypothetical protein
MAPPGTWSGELKVPLMGGRGSATAPAARNKERSKTQDLMEFLLGVER